MSARIQRVEDKNGNAVGETLPLKIERLERENAALLTRAEKAEAECDRYFATLAGAFYAGYFDNATVKELREPGEKLITENAALREAVLFIPKMRWKEDVFNPFHPDVVDEKAAANVIVRRAIEIAGKGAQP